MAAAGLTKTKSGRMVDARKRRDRSLKTSDMTLKRASKSTPKRDGLAVMPTMSTRQYMFERASADIAKIRKAYNSPTGKKVRSSARGFGASVAKASRRTVKAGKQARALYERLR